MSHGVAIRKSGILCYKILKYNTTPKIDINKVSGEVDNSKPPVVYYTYEDLGDGVGSATMSDLSEKGLASPSEDDHDGAVDAADRCYTPAAAGSCAISTTTGDKVQLTDHADFDWEYNTPWTISMYTANNSSTWSGYYVKREVAGGYKGPAIFTDGNGVLQIYLISTWNGGSGPAIHVNGTGTSTVIKQAGRWRHLLVTYDGSGDADGITAWVDGVEHTVDNGKLNDAVDNLGTNSTTNNINPRLCMDTATTNYPPGGIDRTTIWKDVSINNNQAQILYNSGSDSWGDAIDARRGL